MKIKESVMVAAAAAFLFGSSAKAQPVGTMISPGLFIRASGVFFKPSFITLRTIGITFNPFIFGGARPFGPETVGRFFQTPSGPAFFLGDRGFGEFGRSFGQSGGGFDRGFSPGHGRFGFGIDEAIAQERAIRRSATTIGPQSGGPRIGPQGTTAIGPQSGEPAISPEDVSRHIERQESPRSVGGTSPNALGGRGAGHGGGGGHR